MTWFLSTSVLSVTHIVHLAGRANLLSSCYGMLLKSVKTKSFGNWSFHANSPRLWKFLPPELCDASLILPVFKALLKTHHGILIFSCIHIFIYFHTFLKA